MSKKETHIVDELKKVFEKYGYTLQPEANGFGLRRCDLDDNEQDYISFTKEDGSSRELSIRIYGQRSMTFMGGETMPF